MESVYYSVGQNMVAVLGLSFTVVQNSFHQFEFWQILFVLEFGLKSKWVFLKVRAKVEQPC